MASNEEDMESDGEYDDDGFAEYYTPECNDIEETQISQDAEDPESFPVECLTVEKVKLFLEETVNSVAKDLGISTSLTKLLLLINAWDIEKVTADYKTDMSSFLISCRFNPSLSRPSSTVNGQNEVCNGENITCPVCMCATLISETLCLNCNHKFCVDCWTRHTEIKISEGFSTEITCMAQNCELFLLEDFVLNLPISSYLKAQYQQFSFHKFISTHPLLRFCIGPNCGTIFKSKQLLAKRVNCPQCKSIFCFKCGDNYHAPTDCATIKNWLTKCADDSETANYFSAHTKDCPNCNICIEKNGGCNHMQCSKCRHDFCWMCLGDWKGHGAEYYECSRYRENPEQSNESAKARAALRKYLHYYERWQNHAKSLKLEENTLEKIKDRINQKVMNGSGTWIDWQYLLDAASLLAKCRYTLQYTYPYAYYMDQESKILFEYQQAQLEAEIENLSWKIERAETTDRGDLENQMYIAEKRRKTLLKDFFQPYSIT